MCLKHFTILYINTGTKKILKDTYRSLRFMSHNIGNAY